MLLGFSFSSEAELSLVASASIAFAIFSISLKSKPKLENFGAALFAAGASAGLLTSSSLTAGLCIGAGVVREQELRHSS